MVTSRFQTFTYKQHETLDIDEYGHPGPYISAGPHKNTLVHQLCESPIPGNLSGFDFMVRHRLLCDEEALPRVSDDYDHISSVIAKRREVRNR